MLMTHTRGCVGRFGRSRGPGWRQGRMSRRFESVLDILDADPDQRDTLRQVKDELLDANQRFHDLKGGLRRQLRDLWASEDSDAEALKAAVDDRVEGLRALGHRVADALARGHAALTAGQREALRSRFGRRWA